MFVVPLQIDDELRPLLVRYGDEAMEVAAGWAAQNSMVQNGAAGTAQVAEEVCRRVRFFCDASK
jgi:hypothetical protein